MAGYTDCLSELSGHGLHQSIDMHVIDFMMILIIRRSKM